MQRLITLFCLALCAGFLGCGKASRFERHLSRADAAFAQNDFERARIEYLNAVRLNSGNPHVLARLGHIYYTQGESISALRFLEAATKANPGDLSSRARYALLLSSIGDCTNATVEAEAVLAKSQSESEAFLAIAGCATTTNQISAALTRINGVLASQETNSQLHLARGLLLQKQQNIDAAEQSYLRAQALDPKSSKPPFALAGLYWMRGDTNKTGLALQAAADLAPVKSGERLRLAEFKLRTGNSAEGRALLEQSVEKEPDFLPAMNMLAELALTERRTNDCSKLLAKVLKISPTDRAARFLKGRLKIATGEPAEAVTTFESVTRDFPQDVVAHYHLALALAANREPARAIVTLDRVLSLRPTYPEAMLLRSELQVSSGASAAAIPTLISLTTRYPNLPRPYVLLAEAYRAQGTPSDALRVYQQMAKAFPKDPRPSYLVGVLLRQQSKLSEARKAYEAALEIESDFVPAVDQMIELDIEESRFSSALSRIETYIKKYPEKPMPLLLQSKIFYSQKKFAETQATLEKALQLDPDFLLAHRFLVQLHLATGQQATAVQKLEELVRKNEKDTVSLLQLGLLAEAMKEFPKARTYYEKVLSYNPKSPVALNNLAYLLSERLNDVNAALTLAQQARDLSPQDPATADTLGWVLYKRGDYPRSLAVLQGAAEGLAGNPEVAYHLGMAHYANGNEAEAAEALALATRNSTNSYSGIEVARRAHTILRINPASVPEQDLQLVRAAIGDNKGDLFAHLRLAQVHEQQGKFPAAKAEAQLALEANTNSPSVLRYLASLEIERLNNFSSGMDYARRSWALSQSTTNAMALGRLGIISGQYKWALPLLERAYQEQRNNAEISFLLAIAVYTQADLDRPRSLLEPFRSTPQNAELAPGLTAMGHLLNYHAAPSTNSNIRTALSALDAHRYTKGPAQLLSAMLAEDPRAPGPALQKYGALTTAEPEFLLAQRQYAIFAEQVRDDAIAVPLVTRLRQALPNDSLILRAAGRIAYRKKDYPEAIRALRNASRTLSSDAEVLYYLGLAQFHAKDKTARETLNRALALDASSPLAGEARGALSQL